MKYNLKAGLTLFLKNFLVCFFLAGSLAILIATLSSATQSFMRSYENQARDGDYSPPELLQFDTAVTGLEFQDEIAFRRSFFPLFEKDAVTAKLYNSLLSESQDEYVITGDDRFLPQEMRGTEDIRIYYSSSSPPSFETVRFLGRTVSLKPVDAAKLFFLSSWTNDTESQNALFIYIKPNLFTDHRYTEALLGSANFSIYQDYIFNTKLLKSNKDLVHAFLQTSNNEFYSTVSYESEDPEIQFMTGFMAPYLGGAALAVILVLILMGSLLLKQLQQKFAVHMLSGATSQEILLQFLVILGLTTLMVFGASAWLLRWQLERFFWLYLSAFLLYELILIAALFRKLKPDRILQTIRTR